MLVYACESGAGAPPASFHNRECRRSPWSTQDLGSADILRPAYFICKKSRRLQAPSDFRNVETLNPYRYAYGDLCRRSGNNLIITIPETNPPTCAQTATPPMSRPA